MVNLLSKVSLFFGHSLAKIISLYFGSQPVKFGTNDMEAIRNTYMRYKALEALKTEGIIGEISFET